jgi:hypothetical protein
LVGREWSGRGRDWVEVEGVECKCI